MQDSDTSSSYCDCFSESSNTVDHLLESMDEQINDLYNIVKTQNEEIETLKARLDVLKSVIKSHLQEYLHNIFDNL